MILQFYEKPTKHQSVILANSALSMTQKRTILTHECLRIMRNTKIELGQEILNNHLNRFMIKLNNPEKFMKAKHHVPPDFGGIEHVNMNKKTICFTCTPFYNTLKKKISTLEW